jgi:hypothetical protein
MERLGTQERTDFGRREELRCPHCGGLNAASAEWCGQCLEPFPVVEPGDGLKEPSPRVESAPAPERAATGPFRVTSEGITWTCRVCDSVNPFDAARCTVCSATFAQTVNPPDREHIPRDPGAVALASLFWPGAGHALLGLWGQALGRAVTSLWVLSLALVSAVQQGLTAPTSLLFAVVSFALWGAGAHDAYRDATGDGSAVLLTPGRFRYVVLGLLVLSVGSVFVTAMGMRA